MRRLAMWLVMDGPRFPGPLAPWLFGFAIGSRPRKAVKEMAGSERFAERSTTDISGDSDVASTTAP